MTTSDPRWLQLLRAEADSTSIGRAALRVGYSRTAVSQALSGKYPGDLNKLQEKVLAALEMPLVLPCPFIAMNIAAPMCIEQSERKAPTHNPFAMQWWRACQQCDVKKLAKI